MNLQAQYDLDCAAEEIGREIESRIKPYNKAA
jgi:plasmid maintenance system antidote protein VapI